jgi:GNAT acetyltransferase-like protein
MRRDLPKYSRIARTQHDVDAAQRLRFRSLAGELKIGIASDPRVGREISSFDNLETTHHLLLYCDLSLIGTARLALPNREVASANGTLLGFELEQEFALTGLFSIREGLAEVARVCILESWRSTTAVLRLYEGLYCLSRELGVTHWIGGVDCQTSRRDDAELMHSALADRELVDPRIEVFARPHAHIVPGPSAATSVFHSGFYSDGERASAGGRLSELRLASTLLTFTRRLGARCIGHPARHPAFPRFVMPMLVALDQIPQPTLAKFDLSLLAPSLERRAS